MPARFGLIGYGAWGSHHSRAITSVPAASLVAIAANSEASCARARAEHPAAKVYADYLDMLAKESLDVVDVVLPSHLHHSVSRDVLLSGRHLLLEKPMTLSVADCDDLLKLAKEKSRVLAIGHELRLSSLWGTVKDRIAAGAIGEPLYVLIELWRRPYRQGSDGWRYDINRVGNWVLEEPIHFFDLARWYLGDDPVSVYAAANGRQPGRPELHDNFSAIVTFPKGKYAVIAQTLAGWEHHQIAKITGTDGALIASWSGAMDRTFEPTFSLKVSRGQEVEPVPIVKPSGEVFELVDEIEQMTRAVTDGTPPACTGEDGRWSVAMCLKAHESLTTNRPMTFT